MKAEEFNLRKACFSDIEKIMAIENNSFIPEIREKEELFIERICVFPEGFFVVEEEETGHLAGYFSSELWETIPDFNEFSVGHSIKKIHSANGKILYISSFALLENFRGKGNGTKLFNAAIKELESNFLPEKEVLMVNEDWKGARHIYEKSGFMEFCRIEKAFFPSRTGIVMERHCVSF